MTETERSLLAELVRLDELVQSMPTAQPKPNLLPTFARLDELARALPPDSDPSLRHYLAKKSYAKARLHLEGEAARVPRGTC